MPPKSVDGKDIARGKRFGTICEKFFPGQTNVEIGKALGGYPESTIRNWKNGVSIGNTATFQLDKLGISIAYLFNGEGSMMTSRSTNVPYASEIRSLFDTSTTIDTSIRQCLFDTADGKVPEQLVASLLAEIMQRIEQFRSGAESAIKPSAQQKFVVSIPPPPPNASRWNEDIDITTLSRVLPVVGQAAAREFYGGRSGMFDENDQLDIQDIPDTTRLVKVFGDSMSPVILDGQYAMVGPQYLGRGSNVPGERDIVIVEVIPQDPDHEAADREWEGVYCKRITEGEGIWYLHSINDTGDTFSVAKTNCRLWPVIGVWFAGKGKPPQSD